MSLTAEQQEFINLASKTNVVTTCVGAGKGLVKIQMTDLDIGLYETSPNPISKYRTSWIMKLKHEPGKCKLPRGFGHLSGKNI